MNAQLCLPCPKTVGCSRTAPAAHSLTRVLGVGPVRRKIGRVGRVAVRAVLTPNGYSAGSQNAGSEGIPMPSIPSLGESLSLFCSLQGGFDCVVLTFSSYSVWKIVHDAFFLSSPAGCVLSQQYLPGFNLLQGSGWRLGYEASPSSEDDFCATVSCCDSGKIVFAGVHRDVAPILQDYTAAFLTIPLLCLRRVSLMQIGGDRWSLALSAKQFHEFCHLFKV